VSIENVCNQSGFDRWMSVASSCEC